jgi:serine/threonine protein kinase/tetratricopeptide (TPR) repeat protein
MSEEDDKTRSMRQPDPEETQPDAADTSTRSMDGHKPAQVKGNIAPTSLPEISGYTIQGRLGQGGMGTVWRATQHSTKREVALKILSQSFIGSEKDQLRFVREVELAARLQHPHIARVYDSGLDKGVYYYAMELVEGLPLNRYTEKNRLPRKDRLQLLQNVCEAIQHAHQNGVIHRDLKPSNILVTNEGEPRVLDFGLAKLTGPDESSVMLSLDGDVVGTPIFMSPEQAAGNVSQIDTRTDVYSLGVMLYEQVTGLYPHDVSGTNYDIMRRVRDEEPNRPRDADRTVDRELEALLLKALAKDKDERYASAGALAQDIANYLNGDPLTAHTPTTGYFLRKRLRKHRVPVSIAALVAILLLGTGVYSYLRVTQERDEAEAARGEAERNLQTAETQRLRAEENFRQARAAVQESFVKLSGQEFDGVEGMGTLRVIMLRTAKNHYERFIASEGVDPGVYAEYARLLEMLAQQQTAEGNLQDAFNTVTARLSVFEHALTERPDNRSLQSLYIDSLRLLSGEYKFRREYDMAISTATKAVQEAEQLAAAHGLDRKSADNLMLSYECMIQIMCNMGQHAQEIPWRKKDVDIREEAAKLFPDRTDHFDLDVDDYWPLIEHAEEDGQIEEAALYRDKALEALETLYQRFPKNPPQRWSRTNSHLRFALYFRNKGEAAKVDFHLEKARAAAKEMLVTYRNNLYSTLDVASGFWMMGSLFLTLDDPRSAEPFMRAALKAVDELAQKDIGWLRNLAIKYTQLAFYHHKQGDTAKASAFSKQGLDVVQTALDNELFPTRLFLPLSWTCWDMVDLKGPVSDKARRLAFLCEERSDCNLEDVIPGDTVKRHPWTIEIKRRQLERQPEDASLRWSLLCSLWLLADSHVRLNQPAEALRSLKEALDLGDSQPPSSSAFFLYLLARVQSLTAEVVAGMAVSADGLGEPANTYAARAVRTLKQAMEAGFPTGQAFRDEASFASLRDRLDYRALLSELQNGALTESTEKAKSVAARPASSDLYPYQYEQIQAATGRYITVRGIVDRTYQSTNRAGNKVYFEMEGVREGFRGVIDAENLPAIELLLGGAVHDKLPNRAVRISGKVFHFDRGWYDALRPQIEIRWPQQLEVLPDFGGLEREQDFITSEQAPTSAIPWDKARPFVGQKVMVEGIARRMIWDADGWHLHFSDDSSGLLTLEILVRKAKAPWSEPPDQLLLNRKIRATGRVGLGRRGPEIQISSPSQIKILDAAATASPPKPEPSPTITLDNTISWQDAAQRMDETLTVTGLVTSTRNIGTVCFLNFSTNWQQDLAIQLMPGTFTASPERPEVHFLHKTIRASGTITEYRGRPRMTISDPKQIEVVSSQPGTAPKAEPPP